MILGVASAGCDLALFPKKLEQEGGEHSGFDERRRALLQQLDDLAFDVEECDSIGVLEEVVHDVVAEPRDCYLVVGTTTVDGKLVLEEGSKLGFAEEAQLVVAEGGRILGKGSEDNPVELSGVVDEDASWAGIFLGPGSHGNKLSHVRIDGAGDEPPCCEAEEPAAIYVASGAEVELDDLTITRSGGAGVVMEPGSVVQQGSGFEPMSPGGEDSQSDGGVEAPEDEGGDDEAWDAIGGDCEQGRTSCGGQQLLLCILGKWELILDCAENVDSGKTACALYDGQAQCSLTPKGACTEFLRVARGGIPLNNLEAHDAECVGDASCEEARPRACLRANMPGEASFFEGAGEQWISVLAYDEQKGVRNRVSGFAFELDATGDYEIEVYLDQDYAWGEDEGSIIDFEHAGSPCEKIPWVSGAPPFSAVWYSRKEGYRKQQSMRVHVVPSGEGGMCESWKLSMTPNPCPSEEVPEGFSCAP